MAEPTSQGSSRRREVHTGPGPEHTALSGQAAARTKEQSYSAPWGRGKDTGPQVGRPGKPLVKLTRYANRHPALFVDRSPDTRTSSGLQTCRNSSLLFSHPFKFYSFL